MKKVFFLLLLIPFLLESCVSPVTIKGDKEKFKQMKKVALVEFMIAPHESVTFPLIPAAIFNSGLDDIVPLIIDYNKRAVDSYADHMGNVLEKYSGINIIYGQRLYNDELYTKLRNIVQLQPKATNNDDFPELILPDKSYNFLNLTSINIHAFFNKIERYINPSSISTICEELDVDGIIIGCTGITLVEKPGFFISSIERRNTIHLAFFDRTGKPYLRTEANTDYIDGDPENIEDYKQALDLFYKNSEFMIKVLYDLEKNDFRRNHKYRSRRPRT